MFIPFNNQPSSIVFKQNTSYTIPAGYYARVTVTDFNQDFLIDSNIAIPAINYTGTASLSTTGIKLTNTVGYPISGSFWISSTSAGAVGATVVLTRNHGSASSSSLATLNSASNLKQLTLYPGDYFTCTVTDANDTLNWSYSFSYNSNAMNPVFWVPSGTDLDGQRYMVELYPVLS